MGIDNGGTVSKVVIFDTEGNEIQSSSRKVKAHYPQPGWTERDTERVWTSTAEAIRDALAQSGIDPAKVLAIGNTAHGNGIYLLDKHNEPLRPGIISTDSRAARLVKELKAAIGDQVWSHTYQQLWSSSTAILLAWFKRHQPAVYDQIGSVIYAKDYVKYRLTGELTSDYTDMSAANMLDLRQQNYSQALFDLFEMSDAMGKMPPLLKSTDIAGRVTAAAARETGLSAGTPVVGGILDVLGTAIGTGAVKPGQACIIAGTWSINEVVVPEPVDDQRVFMNSMFTDDTWMLLEASPTSASNLEWFIQHFCVEEQQEADARGISVYDVCNEKVAALAPGSTNILFHPFLFGSNVQGNARAGFYGMGGWHTREHLLRAVYEGIVYNHMSHVDKLRLADIHIDVARFGGGAARSQVWVQMFADALGFPIELVEGEEMGTRGAAMCAGIGVGVYSDVQDAVSKAVKVRQHFEPNPEVAHLYRERYEIHQHIASVMGEAWNRISDLVEPE